MGADLLSLGLAAASDTRVAAGRAVPHAAQPATFPRAMYYRWRYTVLDLAREAGRFEELVDEVFAPGGLWT